MKNIDFLPERYREQGAVDRAKYWQIGLVCAIGCAIAVAAFYQAASWRHVDAQLAAIEPMYQDAQAKTQRLAELNQRLVRDGALAELYAYLGHPWPRTRLLAALAEALPAELSLVEIRLVRDQSQATSTGFVREQPPGSAANGAPATPPPPGAAEDLARLRAECDAAPLVLLVSGETENASALHDYLARLKLTQLFERAEVTSISTRPREGSSGNEALAEFHVRLVIRPGHGQAGGPAAPVDATTTDAAAEIAEQSTTGDEPIDEAHPADADLSVTYEEPMP